MMMVVVVTVMMVQDSRGGRDNAAEAPEAITR